MTYAQRHIGEAIDILNKLDVEAVEAVVDLLATVKSENGRLFYWSRR